MKCNELQTLLILNGGKRIEHLEEEIFSSDELAKCYISFIVEKEIPILRTRLSTEKAAFYACYVLQKRWLEAEPFIVKCPAAAYWYSIRVIKSRWPEAESCIKENNTYWKVYQRDLSSL